MGNFEITPTNKELNNIIKKTFNSLDIAQSTRKEYFNKIHNFLDFVEKNWFDENVFIEYKNHLKEREDISVASKNLYLTSARILLKQMYKMWKLPIDVTFGVKSFAQNKKHKKFGLNQEEIDKVINYLKTLDQQDTHNKLKKIRRIKAVFALLMFQWLRQIELIRLNVEDVDISNNVIFVMWKWKYDKEKVNLHPIASETLKDYINIFNITTGPLFFSISNNSYQKRLTTRSLRRIVKDIFLNLDIDKSTHWFRHFFTTKLLRDFHWDIMKTRKFTRHSSLEMLLVYNDEIETEKNLKDFYESFEDMEF